MQNTSSQSLCTFSEEVGVVGGCGQLMAEGKVNQKADIQPVSSDVYMKLKGCVYHSRYNWKKCGLVYVVDIGTSSEQLKRRRILHNSWIGHPLLSTNQDLTKRNT